MFFWNSLAFSMIQRMLAIWSLVFAFSKTSLNIRDFTVHVLLQPVLENFEHYFTSMWDECNCAPQRNVFFIIRDWNAKVGSQEIPGVTGKFGLGMWNEAGQRLIEFCQENALIIANTLFQQHKRRLHMDITRRSTLKSDWLYSLQPKMEKLYTVNKNKTRSWLWLRSWTPYYQILTQIEESRENQ